MVTRFARFTAAIAVFLLSSLSAQADNSRSNSGQSINSDFGKTEFAVNEASIIQTGNANSVSFDQESSIEGYGNFLEVTQIGMNNEATIIQVGDSNQTRINQTGNWNVANVRQTGSSNSIDLTQAGNGNIFYASQSGSDNRIVALQH